MRELKLNTDFFRPLSDLVYQVGTTLKRSRHGDGTGVDLAPLVSVLAHKCIADDVRQIIKQPSQANVTFDVRELQTRYAQHFSMQCHGNRRLFPLPIIGDEAEEALYFQEMSYARPRDPLAAMTQPTANLAGSPALYAYRCQDKASIRAQERRVTLGFLMSLLGHYGLDESLTAICEQALRLLSAQYSMACRRRNALAVTLNDPLVLSELRDVLAVEDFSPDHDLSSLTSPDGLTPTWSDGVFDGLLARELKELLLA